MGDHPNSWKPVWSDGFTAKGIGALDPKPLNKEVVADPNRCSPVILAGYPKRVLDVGCESSFFQVVPGSNRACDTGRNWECQPSMILSY